MERWNSIKNKYEKSPKKIEDFLSEIDELCKKYNLSISHEDDHGAFILERYSEFNIKRLKNAFMDLEKQKVVKVRIDY